METTRTTNAPLRARASVHLREAGSEGILYDVELRRVHVLNATALAVWKLCRERKTDAEIAESLSESYGLPVETLVPDVADILNDLADLGLLEGRGPAAASPAPSEGGAP